MKNIAFIDGQNLHLGTKEDDWKIDLTKFRVYLKDKYKVAEAYYFVGYKKNERSHNLLYRNIEKSGFILIFKEHSNVMTSLKRGNVDADIVFEVMKNILENKVFSKVVLVSGDGDYKKLVDYLLLKNKFEKILFPNKKFASSLYKNLTAKFFDSLSGENIKNKIIYKL